MIKQLVQYFLLQCLHHQVHHGYDVHRHDVHLHHCNQNLPLLHLSFLDAFPGHVCSDFFDGRKLCDTIYI